jgi:hypothetical protein
VKNCGTCRFMAAKRDWDTHRVCARIIHGNSSELDENGVEAEERSANELAVVTDGSGYAAVLRVLPEFGCVLHETKVAT